MNLASHQKHFRRMTKFIWLGNQAKTQVDELEKGMGGAIAQDADASEASYTALTQATLPFQARVNTTLTQLAQLESHAATATQDYLRKVVATDLGQAANTALNTVGTALVADMTSAGATVSPSGTIANWFTTKHSINLPTDGSPTVPDSYVDDDIVVA